jgi:hypothetical protein
MTARTDKPKTLTCSCCGAVTRGRQWWNRDTGYGLCRSCADWLATREPAETVQFCYGTRGVHYALEDQT